MKLKRRIRLTNRNKMTLHTGRIHALAFAALIFMLVSCEADEPSRALAGTGKGEVVISLSSAVDIDVRSEASPISDYDDYNFRYVGVDGYATSEYYRYGSVQWPMEWYLGIFRLQAESCTVEEAETGYGCIRYEGVSEPFSVISGQTARANVTCSLANVRVNVTFNDKMFQAYADFRLDVLSVIAPVYEDDENGDEVLVTDEQEIRTLEFTPIIKTGFFNIYPGEMNLKYRLYVRMDGAEIYQLQKEGYLMSDSGCVDVIGRGDDVTFNVKYEGDLPMTEGVKFIVDGERKTMKTGLEINDYEEGSVVEDE